MNRAQRRSGAKPLPHQDHILTRTGGADVATFMLPNLNERLALLSANRASLGYLEEDDDKPTGLMNTDDVSAVVAAAIGLCYRSGADLEFPTFREMGRDIIAYGEAVQTVLWTAGYRDPSPLGKIGDILIGWVGTETFGERAEVTKLVEDFPKAPQ